MPMVVTLHTVLANPPAGRARTLRALCQRAALIMVFTETARRMLGEQGLAEPERVRVVPHGAPDELTQAAWADGVDEDIASSSLQLPSLAGRTVLSTFGLISDSKGLELAIRALPSIVASHPEVLYLIAGQTHPELLKERGYRVAEAAGAKDRGDMAMIAYGAEVERRPDPMVRQWRVEPNRYVLYVSRLEPENNAHLVIEAFDATGRSVFGAIEQEVVRYER
jgi:glycosyltransferase involved in cell wall biosynthesis